MKKLIILFMVILTAIDSRAQNPNFVWAKQFGGVSSEVGTSITYDASGNIYTTGHFAGTCDFDPGVATYTLTSFGVNDIFISKLDAAGNFIWAKQFGGSNNEVGNSIKVDASGNVYTTGYFSTITDFDPSAATYTLSSFGNGDAFVSKLDAAGNFIWAKQLGGSSAEIGNDISIDASGNVYTIGYFSATSDFDPGVAVYSLSPYGNNDVFVSKLDAAGNFIWAKQLGGASTDVGLGISIDASGNVYTAGYFGSTSDFDPGAGTYTLSSFGNSDIFVSKLDVAGNFIWAKQLGGTGFDFGNDISIDASGNVYATGQFASICDFDPGAATYTLNSFGINDVFVSKLDAAGNFIWAKQFGGTGSDVGYCTSIDISGNVYTTGSFSLTSDFDPGAGTYTLNAFGGNDVFVSKLDASGNFIWAEQLGGSSAEIGYGISVDPSGNVYTTGYFGGTSDFDPGTGTYNLISFGGVSDIFAHKMCQSPPSLGAISGLANLCSNSSGNYSVAPVTGVTSYAWSLPTGWLGSSTTNTIFATPGSTGIFTVVASNGCGTSPQQTLNITVNALPSVNATSSASLICTGQTATLTASGATSYTWNTTATTTAVFVSPTVTTSYTVNGIDANGCANSTTITQSVSVCTGLIEQAGNETSLIYPNPSTDKVTIKIENRSDLKIINVLGQIAYRTHLEKGINVLSISNLSSGIYYFVIEQNDLIITQKIIKQ